jgi:hypothetical protein
MVDWVVLHPISSRCHAKLRIESAAQRAKAAARFYRVRWIDLVSALD